MKRKFSCLHYKIKPSPDKFVCWQIIFVRNSTHYHLALSIFNHTWCLNYF